MIELFKEVDSLDKRCYEEYNLNEDILMEHAAYEIALHIYKKNPKKITIIAGPGNNGADGITLARILLKDYKVNLFLPFGAKSEMAKIQLDRFLKIGGKLSQKIKKADIYVDALFGSGLKRDLNDETINIIKQLNNLKGYKIACDIPTGIDINGNLRPIAFKADKTITMGARKLALYSDEAKDYVGKIKQANLGVSFNVYKDKSNYFLLQKKDLNLPIRKEKNSHKGKYGHLAVISGDKEGASIISAMAALNFGAGLVTIISKNKLQIPYEIMQSNQFNNNFSAIAIGMGLGDNEYKKYLNNNLPKIIDADMFYKEDLINYLDNAVLTPHPKEFSSLLKLTNLGEYSIQEIQKNRFFLAENFSKKFTNSVLVLKGANTIIAYQGKLFINPYGTNALSKGGSGDILSGLIGSLLAQGYSLLDSAINGSLAISFAGKYKPNYALTPTKIIKNLEKL